MHRFLPILLVAWALSVPLRGQDLSPRVGFGPELLVNANDEELSEKNAALGFRLRASKPLNTDVSAAVDLGLLGFFVQGQQSADYSLNPQISLIVTLPGRSWAPYVMGGVGGLFPVSGPADGGVAMTVHGGYGWARLLSDVSVYMEIDPALVLRQEATRLLIPLRAGLIF